MNETSRKIKLENYSKAYDLIIEALEGMPRDMWDFKPSPSKWSIHEILLHLPDSEANSYVRCRKFLAEPGSRIFAYDQDKWAESLDYHSQNPDDALELFRLLRKMTYDVIKDLPESVWQNLINHEYLGDITLDYWLDIYEEHIPAHISQMEKVHREWLETKAELN